MHTHELIDLFKRRLPCPPDPMPPMNSEADYLWRATLFNAAQEKPHRIVQMRPRRDAKIPAWDHPAMTPIISVECDERGKGIRVL